MIITGLLVVILLVAVFVIFKEKIIPPTGDIETEDALAAINYGKCLVKGKKYNGWTLKNTYESSAENCAKRCNKEDKCVAFAYKNSTGLCRLRRRYDGTSSSSNYTSGHKYNCKDDTSSSSSGSGKCQNKGKYYTGSSLYNTKASSANDCANKCNKEDRCVGYAYKNNGICRLRKKITKEGNHSRYTSGYKKDCKKVSPPSSPDTPKPSKPSSGGWSVNYINPDWKLLNRAWSNCNGNYKNSKDRGEKVVLLDGLPNEWDSWSTFKKNKQKEIKKYHDKGKKVIGYISVGSGEDWKKDYDDFKDTGALGSPMSNWGGERWIKVDKWEKSKNFFKNRFKLLAEYGFDGVEFDNIGMLGIPQNKGKGEKLANFAEWLAKTAKSYGLAPIFKNGSNEGGMVIANHPKVRNNYPAIIIEEALAWKSEKDYKNWKGKPVWIFEYDKKCGKGAEKSESWIKDRLSDNPSNIKGYATQIMMDKKGRGHEYLYK